MMILSKDSIELEEVKYTTDKLSIELDSVSELAGKTSVQIAELLFRIEQLEAKVNNGHRAPAHWEGKL